VRNGDGIREKALNNDGQGTILNTGFGILIKLLYLCAPNMRV
jgi:hypothetical protein